MVYKIVKGDAFLPARFFFADKFCSLNFVYSNASRRKMRAAEYLLRLHESLAVSSARYFELFFL
jgi:hypothetical protein